MRTNIVIDDNLIKSAMLLSGIETKKAVVEESLKLFVRLKKQESVKKWRSKMHWDGDLNKMRIDNT